MLPPPPPFSGLSLVQGRAWATSFVLLNRVIDGDSKERNRQNYIEYGNDDQSHQKKQRHGWVRLSSYSERKEIEKSIAAAWQGRTLEKRCLKRIFRKFHHLVLKRKPLLFSIAFGVRFVKGWEAVLFLWVCLSCFQMKWHVKTDLMMKGRRT